MILHRTRRISNYMNLIEALESRGIRWKKSGRPNNIWLCCPFCEERGYSADTRFRLGVDVSTGHGHCFNCEWKPPRSKLAIIALQRKLDLGDWVDPEPVTRRRMKPVRLPEDYEVLEAPVHGFWAKRAYKYITGRGVTDEQISKYRIGFSEVGPDAYRIIIPIYYAKKLQGIVGRSIRDDIVPKYKNSTGDKAVFGLPKKKKKKCVILEGVLDAMACDRALNDSYDCLAILGHAITDKQEEMLEGYSEYILWPDPDEAGYGPHGFPTIAEKLTHYGTVKIVMPVTGDLRDPDEIEEKEVRRRVWQAQIWSSVTQHKLKAWLVYQE